MKYKVIIKDENDKQIVKTKPINENDEAIKMIKLFNILFKDEKDIKFILEEC